jgi:hypothetical protein
MRARAITTWLALAGLILLIGAPTATLAATPQCISDPAADVLNWDTFEQGAYPKADITQACLTYGDTITVSMKLAQASNPTSDPNWTDGFTSASWGLDATGDDLADHLAVFSYYQGALHLEVASCGQTSQGWVCSTANLACSGTPTYDATSYSGTFPASCIGAPAQVRMQSMMSYDDQGTSYDDTAPDDDGWSAPISKSTENGGGGGGGTTRATGRLSGPDRIATAVAISQYQFPGGAAEVYLARADNFPDALAGGALTKGPVLLVPSCGELPAVVKAEIARLNPAKVVALGGTAAVCDAMLTQAANS